MAKEGFEEMRNETGREKRQTMSGSAHTGGGHLQWWPV